MVLLKRDAWMAALTASSVHNINRPQLQGMLLDCETKRIVGSDEHRMVVAPIELGASNNTDPLHWYPTIGVDADEIGKRFVISNKNAPKLRRYEVRIILATTEQDVVLYRILKANGDTSRMGELDLITSPAYPNYLKAHRVADEDGGSCSETTFNPQLVTQVLEAIRLSRDEMPMVKFSWTNCDAPNLAAIRCVIMGYPDIKLTIMPGKP